MPNYNFSDLFTINPADNEPPFDFNFNHINLNEYEGRGAGIYLIFDIHQDEAHRLIYIGMHNKNEPFHQNRVSQHLASITFRQKNAFGISANCANNIDNIEQLQKHFHKKFSKNIGHTDLYQEVFSNLEQYPWRAKDVNTIDSGFVDIVTEYRCGTETSRRRFEYACTFWDFFSDNNNINNESFDNRFKFTWIDLNDDIEDLAQTRPNKTKVLEDIEKQLIWQFHPIINSEMYNAGILLDRNYSNLFSLGNNLTIIRNKVLSKIDSILRLYRFIQG